MPELVVDNSGFGEWRRQMLLNDRKKPIECRENVYLILRNHPVWKDRVAFDEFAQRVVLRSSTELADFAVGEWTNEYDMLLGLWLAHTEGLVCRNERTLGLGTLMAAKRTRFHPVRVFLDGLVWDQVQRIGSWLVDFLGAAQTPYTERVGRYFLLNMVARVFQPGCIMRSVPVLEGAQNRGKSTALRILAEPWFSDTHLNLNTKDVFQTIQGIWLYEIPEMASFSRAEVARVKEFISSRDDNFRPPYEGRNVKPKRQVTFAGSTNEALYLRDWTGNTRFWPFSVEQVAPINLEGLADARDQLLAEAVALFRAGERRHPTREEESELFKPEQEQREIEHPWQALIENYLASMTADRTTVGEILSDCLKFESSKLLDTHSQTVGRVMHRLGWARKRESASSGGRWYYARPEKPRQQPPDPSEVPF